jgi:mannose-6-phosphate isomerase-like protein (cupin superfamily)
MLGVAGISRSLLPLRLAAVLVTATVSNTVLSADATGTLLTSADIDTTARALIAQAQSSPGGEAGKVMEQSDEHWLLLLARVRTGESEVHERWTDEIFVIEGAFDLVIGGSMSDKHPFGTAAGEYHGAGLNGGKTFHLARGDTIDVPAGIPHWMKVTSSEPVVTLIYKVK